MHTCGPSQIVFLPRFSRLFVRLLFVKYFKADEIRFYQDEASKCADRAEAAKRKKGALQGEQGSLNAQLRHQVSFRPSLVLLLFA